MSRPPRICVQGCCCSRWPQQKHPILPFNLFLAPLLRAAAESNIVTVAQSVPELSTLVAAVQVGPRARAGSLCYGVPSPPSLRLHHPTARMQPCCKLCLQWTAWNQHIIPLRLAAPLPPPSSQAAGLVDALAAPAAPLTVFAPTNDAFAAALAALNFTAEELLGNTELLTAVRRRRQLAWAPTTCAHLRRLLALALTHPCCVTSAACLSP